MEQHKTRTYLLYAVGEILLVVIGIMLAVQANNWVSDSNNEARRQELVKALTSEFESNLAQIDTMLIAEELIIASGDELVEIIRNREEEVPEAKIIELIRDNSWLWTFDPLNGVLKGSISSGDIHLLKNDSLKTLLFSWESRVLDGREDQERAIKHFEERHLPFMDQYIRMADYNFYDEYTFPPSSFKANYKEMLFDPLFENHVMNRTMHNLDIITELRPLQQVNRKIIQLLKEE